MKSTNLYRAFMKSTNLYRFFRKSNNLNRAFRKSEAVSCAWVFAATELISRIMQVHLYVCQTAG